MKGEKRVEGRRTEGINNRQTDRDKPQARLKNLKSMQESEEEEMDLLAFR